MAAADDLVSASCMPVMVRVRILKRQRMSSNGDLESQTELMAWTRREKDE